MSGRVLERIRIDGILFVNGGLDRLMLLFHLCANFVGTHTAHRLALHGSCVQIRPIVLPDLGLLFEDFRVGFLQPAVIRSLPGLRAALYCADLLAPRKLAHIPLQGLIVAALRLRASLVLALAPFPFALLLGSSLLAS